MSISRAARVIQSVRTTCKKAFWYCLAGTVFSTGALICGIQLPGDPLWPLVFFVLTILTIVGYVAALVIGQLTNRRDFAAALAGGELGSDPIILFLRSFDVAKSGLSSRVLRIVFRSIFGALHLYAKNYQVLLDDHEGDDDPTVDFTRGVDRYDVEEELADAIDSRAMFVAIGNKRASYGAAKILVEDDGWKALFNRLADAAFLILMMPGPSSSVLWEVTRLFEDPRLLKRTVFVMPRGMNAKRWAEIAGMISARLGVALPEYQTAGCYFRPGSAGQPSQTLPLEIFSFALDKYLSESAKDGNLSCQELWDWLLQAQESSGRIVQPKTLSDWAARVAATGFIEDGEELVKQLDGTVTYRQNGHESAEAPITVRVLGEERGFENGYAMVQWIIKDLVPKAASTVTKG